MRQTPWQQDHDSRKSVQNEKRMAVLHAAATLFTERGFDRTSLDDVANSLGITKPTVYYYVQSKDQMLFECKNIASDHLANVLSKVEAASGTGLEKVLSFFHSYAFHVADAWGKCFVLIDHSSLKPDTLEKVRDMNGALDRRVRKLIISGIKDGSIREWEPKTLGFFLFGSFNWIAHWHQPNGPQTIEQTADAFVAIARATMERLPSDVAPPKRAPAQKKRAAKPA